MNSIAEIGFEIRQTTEVKAYGSTKFVLRRCKLSRFERFLNSNGMFPSKLLPSKLMCLNEFDSRDSSAGREPPSSISLISSLRYMPFSSQVDSSALADVYQSHSFVYVNQLSDTSCNLRRCRRRRLRCCCCCSDVEKTSQVYAKLASVHRWMIR